MLALIMSLTMMGADPSVLSVPVAPLVASSTFSSQDLINIATDAAKRYGLNTDRFIETFKCEIKKRKVDGVTVWDYTAQSDHYLNGVREDSWGMWQINLYWNPEVTKAQAQDPYWSTEWAAQMWSKGLASRWSCWRILYGGR